MRHWARERTLTDKYERLVWMQNNIQSALIVKSINILLMQILQHDPTLNPSVCP